MRFQLPNSFPFWKTFAIVDHKKFPVSDNNCGCKVTNNFRNGKAFSLKFFAKIFFFQIQVSRLEKKNLAA